MEVLCPEETPLSKAEIFSTLNLTRRENMVTDALLMAAMAGLAAMGFFAIFGSGIFQK